MTLDDLLVKVTADDDVVSGIAAVVDQIVAQDTAISAQLRALLASGGIIDPAKLQAISDKLDAQTTILGTKRDEISAAVVANTI